MDYSFLAEQDRRISANHRNLLFCFYPTAVVPILGLHVINKVPRWALFLSRVMYSKHHKSIEHNIMANMISRWLKRLPWKVGRRGTRN